VLCGIDEAGRGPLAGPLVVAGVILNEKIEGLNDSKVLSEKKRQALFEKIKSTASYHIVFTHNDIIDEKGLSVCLKQSILEIMNTLNASNYLMDGNTAFGISNLNFKIKADATIQEVSAASILAKVSRDDFMQKIALQYPQYGFEKHKGYGTAAHIDAIKQHGYCKLHRISFKTKALQEYFQNKQETLF
jgi:ribonuclease HII